MIRVALMLTGAVLAAGAVGGAALAEYLRTALAAGGIG